MGCSGAKEKLEDRMMLVKLARMEIQMEKEKELKKLSEMEGKPVKRGIVKRGIVPDYIDPVFAKERNLYDDDMILQEKKTDIVGNKKNVKSVKKSETKAKSEIIKKKVKRSKNQDKISDINVNIKKKKVK